MAFYIDIEGEYQELPKTDMYNDMSLHTGLHQVEVRAESGTDKSANDTKGGLYREHEELNPPDIIDNDPRTPLLKGRVKKQPWILKRLRDKLKSREGYNELSIHKRKVRNFMKRPKAIAFEDIRIIEAWALFKQHQLHFITIVDHHKHFRGVISDRGLLSYLLENANEGALDGGVEAFLMDHVPVLDPDSDLRKAALTAIDSPVGVIPVVDSGGNVVGMVDPVDILRTIFINMRPLNVLI